MKLKVTLGLGFFGKDSEEQEIKRIEEIIDSAIGSLNRRSIMLDTSLVADFGDALAEFVNRIQSISRRSVASKHRRKKP